MARRVPPLRESELEVAVFGYVGNELAFTGHIQHHLWNSAERQPVPLTVTAAVPPAKCTSISSPASTLRYRISRTGSPRSMAFLKKMWATDLARTALTPDILMTNVACAAGAHSCSECPQRASGYRMGIRTDDKVSRASQRFGHEPMAYPVAALEKQTRFCWAK